MNEEAMKTKGAVRELIVMTNEDKIQLVLMAAEAGAKAAMDKMEQEHNKLRKESEDRRLHNTRLLIKNYHMLKDNSENSIFGRSQMEECAADILESMMNIYNDEVVVESIKRTASRTAIIVSHITTMLGLYEVYCERSSNEIDTRRYEIIYDLYIADCPLTMQEVAEKQNIVKRQVYKDIDAALECLSALIFGVDGMKLR